jgi:hypothetical protein
VDRAACECVGVVGSIAARRQHGSECLLPRGSAAAVRCAPCVPAAVPGCVLHQGSFVRLLPAYPVSTQQPSLRHPASRAALPAGGRLEGPSKLLWGAHAGVRQPSRALSSRGPERAPVLRVYSFGSEGVLQAPSLFEGEVFACEIAVRPAGDPRATHLPAATQFRVTPS